MALQRLEIPTDVVRVLLSFVGDDDVATVASLCLVSRDFLYPCRDWLFKSIIFDFRASTATLTRKGLALGSFLKKNPEYPLSIRRFVLTDNGTESSTVFRVYNPRQEERENKISFFTDRSEFAGTLATLSNVRTLSISFIHLSCTWKDLSPLSMSAPLTRIFRNDILQYLRLEGVEDMHFYALRYFFSLRELHLIRCTLADRDPQSFRQLLSYSKRNGIHFIPNTFDEYHQRTNTRLHSLVLGELEGGNFKDLYTEFWMRDWGSATVDLLNPVNLNIRHSSLGQGMVDIPSISLRQASITLEDLILDTTGIAGEIESVSVAQYESLSLALSAMMSYVRPISFPRLSHLTLRISHWPIRGRSETNGELQWALEFLQGIQASQLVTIDIYVTVFGDGVDALLNLSVLFWYLGWSSWDEALVNSKWKDLTSFSIIICSNTDSNLGVNRPHIHETVYSKFVRFSQSGRLSVTHRRQSRSR